MRNRKKTYFFVDGRKNLLKSKRLFGSGFAFETYIKEDERSHR